MVILDMKFSIEDYRNSINNKLLTYFIDEYSFDIEPAVTTVNFAILVNNIDLIVDENNHIIQLSGFCPYANWVKSDFHVPKYKKEILSVKNQMSPGFSYRINNEEWIFYFNNEGWVCIGNPEKQNTLLNLSIIV